MSLAVVIPTLNEAIDLPETLKSLAFADEILIVDSGSTDDTVRIAKEFGARTIYHPFTSYSETRNYADKNINSDWILSIDADVTVPRDLATEIQININRPSSIAAYYIGRINIIWGKAIMHADWGPKDDIHLRLYKRGSGIWQSVVHEQFFTSQPTAKLKNYLIHQNYRSVDEFIDKTNSYSSLVKTQSPRILLWLNPLKDFLKRFFYKLGFLDGYRGLFLSYLQAIYHLNILVKTTNQ